MIFPPGISFGKVQQETRQTSRTYRLDLENNRIVGMIDGIEAIKQAVYKILETERFTHFVYSGNYGMERRREGGMSLEIERWVTESLVQDDRITAVQDFQVTFNGDEAEVSFTVVSIHGYASFERRVGL